MLCLAACTANPTSTSAPPATDTNPPIRPTDLEGARAAWSRANIDTYTLVMKVTDCDACPSPRALRWSTTVTDGEISDRSVPQGFKARSTAVVEDLFDWIHAAGPDGVQEVEYNEIGVPTYIRFDDPDAFDDEGTYEIVFMVP
jgi:hypothetical protein